MIDLLRIKETLEGTETDGGDDPVAYIEEAIQNLKTAQEAMNTISVRGRSNLDALLGCMIGLDMIIGEEKDGRQNNK